MKKYLLAFLGVGLVTTILHTLAFYHILPPSLTFSDVALFAHKATSHGWFYLDKNIFTLTNLNIFQTPSKHLFVMREKEK